jgi:hypothetical protein
VAAPFFGANMDQLVLPSNNYQENDIEDMLRTEIYGKPPPLKVRFYIGSQKDMDESEKAGRPGL